MTVFWIFAGLLTLVSVAVLLAPLLRRRSLSSDTNDLNLALVRDRMRELEREAADGSLTPEQLEAARTDLKRELLLDVSETESADGGETRPALVGTALVAVSVPLLAIVLYLQLGDLSAIKGVPTAHQQQTTAEDIGRMIERLEGRLAQHPNDAGGWIALARSHNVLQQWDKAKSAFARALELAPDNADVMVEYAGLLGRDAEGRLDGRPADLIKAALLRQPEHLNGLFLMGHVHFQLAEYREAVEAWQKVASRLPQGGADRQQVEQYIAQASQELGEPMVQAPPAGKSLRVSVSLDPALADAVSPDQTLFIYARALQGPRMPLAIQRLRAADLPVEVTLDESMAMVPEMTLARFDQVAVEARISSSGNAMPQSGDLRGTLSPVSPGDEALVQIVIDSRVP